VRTLGAGVGTSGRLHGVLEVGSRTDDWDIRTADRELGRRVEEGKRLLRVTDSLQVAHPVALWASKRHRRLP
jgi:hypothetical protein